MRPRGGLCSELAILAAVVDEASVQVGASPCSRMAEAVRTAIITPSCLITTSHRGCHDPNFRT